MNIIESLLNENIKLSYKKKLKESPSKKVYIVTKDGKYYPMDRYKANKWLVDNGIEDFVVRPGKDSEGNPVDYFYCKEDSKLKVNEGIDESVGIKRLNTKPLKVDYDEEVRDKFFIYNNHKFYLGNLWSAIYDDVPEYIIGVTDENPDGSFPLYVELVENDYEEPEYVNVYKINDEERVV